MTGVELFAARLRQICVSGSRAMPLPTGTFHHFLAFNTQSAQVPLKLPGDTGV